MRIEYTAEITCVPQRLWQCLEEPELQKKWMKGLQEMTSNGPSRVGSSFHMKIKEGRRVAEYEGQITAHDPPRHLGIRFWGGAFSKGMAMRVDYRLTDLNGRTRLNYVAELEAERLGFVMKLLLPLLKLFSKVQLKSFMKSLKRLAEETA